MSTSRPRRLSAVLTATALVWASGTAVATATQTDDDAPVERQQEEGGEAFPEGDEQAPEGEQTPEGEEAPEGGDDPLSGVLGEDDGDEQGTEEDGTEADADAFGDDADAFAESTDDEAPVGGVDAGFGGLAASGATGTTAVGLATALLAAAGAAWLTAARRFGVAAA